MRVRKHKTFRGVVHTGTNKVQSGDGGDSLETNEKRDRVGDRVDGLGGGDRKEEDSRERASKKGGKEDERQPARATGFSSAPAAGVENPSPGTSAARQSRRPSGVWLFPPRDYSVARAKHSIYACRSCVSWWRSSSFDYIDETNFASALHTQHTVGADACVACVGKSGSKWDSGAHSIDDDSPKTRPESRTLGPHSRVNCVPGHVLP